MKLNQDLHVAAVKKKIVYFIIVVHVVCFCDTFASFFLFLKKYVHNLEASSHV